MIALSVPQRMKNDCGIAALAMALMVEYETVWKAYIEVFPKGMFWCGLSLKDLEAISLHLGRPLMRQKPKTWNPNDCASGVIKVKWNGNSYSHYVATRGGLVIDTDGSIFYPHTYPDLNDCRYVTRLVLGAKGEDAD